MTVETFFEKFELFADAPNAVEKMREIVRQLAVTRRLVESAGDWVVRPLKSLATKIGSGATPEGGRESYFTTGIPLIRSMNVHFGGFEPKGLVFLSDKQAKGLANAVVQPDDVLLNITGASIGRVTTAPLEIAGARVNQHVTIIRPTSELLPRFLTLFLASPAVQWMINDIEVGATRQALTKGMIEQFEIPLPPLAEQKRIVAKVDELMALCDRLEAQQKEREAKHADLARAALARFAEAPTPANLGYLFHPSYAIEPAELRKSILRQAFLGRLGARTADLETVAKLYDSMLAEHRLLNQGASRHYPSPEPLDREALPQLPPHFMWVPLELACPTIVDSPHRTPVYSESGTHPALRPRDVAGGVLRLSQTAKVDGAEYERQTERRKPQPGDLIYSRELSFGWAVLLPREPAVCLSQGMVSLKHSAQVDGCYLRLVLNSPVVRDQAQASAIGAAHPHVNLKNIRRFAIPLSPLPEQLRIVEKVDQLMALVDRLEAQLAKSRSAAGRLMEAVVAELTAPDEARPAAPRRDEAETATRESFELAGEAGAFPARLFAGVPSPDATSTTAAEGGIVGRRARVAAYLLYELKADPHFRRTKLEKLNHLIEYHCGVDLRREPVRDEHGPNDYAALRGAEDYAADPARGWFAVHDAADGYGVEYRPGPGLAEAAEAQRRAFGDKLPAVRALVSLLRQSTKGECEVIATLYAAWNDLLLAGQNPDDAAIIGDVRENWHPAKKKIPAANWQAGLDWMRGKSLVPRGTGRPVPHKPEPRDRSAR